MKRGIADNECVILEQDYGELWGSKKECEDNIASLNSSIESVQHDYIELTDKMLFD